ncbi:collagen-like protein [Maribacter sp. 2210JD10-5]|uniref:collagen-like protein n=1 Tax=Maribacter sp. 2210JD10-5 TaxID=3386272 RepID=UPI0039BD19C1
MKKLKILFGSFLTVLFISCEGPEGPPGFDGFDGEDGRDGREATVIEVENVNFSYEDANNWYTTRITFGDLSNLEIRQSDAILVYRFDGTVDLTDGPADNWSPLPQNFFLDQGTIQYTFAHNFVDMDMFIDGNFDLIDLNTDFTQEQIFRIVIVPGQFDTTGKFDTSNINAVMGKYGISEADVLKMRLE